MAEINAPAWYRRALALLTVAGVALLLTLALPAQHASAHVSADPASSPAQGGWGTARFQVPTESQTASTTRLEFGFADATSFTSLRTLPIPGWTASIERAGDGKVQRLVWTADDPSSAIKPDEFGAFTISAGPWPATESVAIPVTQFYSDGKVVEWNERALDHHAELDHPAPVVHLSAPTGADAHGGGASGGDESADHAAQSDDDNGGTGVAIGIAVAALVIAAAAAGYAWVVHRRLRSR